MSTLVNGPGDLYAAKLLFQFRVETKRKRYARRVCEERVILMRARSAKQALSKAKRYGAAESFTDAREGRRIFFELVGVVDLDTVFADFDEDPTEVWYELRERLRPMERRRELLVEEKHMRAFEMRTLGRGRVRIYGPGRCRGWGRGDVR